MLNNLTLTKKIVLALASVLIAVLVGTAVYFALPQQKDVNLKIDADNLSVNVQETVKLEYTVSIENALVTISIKDKNVANIITNSDGYFVSGISKGQTDLIISGQYRSESAVKTILIVVNESSTPQNDENGNNSNHEEQPISPEPTEPDDPDNENGSTDETPPDNNEENNQDDENQEIGFTNLRNCSLNGNTIIAEKSTIIFTIVFDDSFTDLEVLFDGTLQSADTNLGNNTYKLNVTGTHILQIKINSKTYVYEIIKN